MGVTQKSNQRVKEVTQGEGLAWMSSPQAREFWGGGKGGRGRGGVRCRHQHKPRAHAVQSELHASSACAATSASC